MPNRSLVLVKVTFGDERGYILYPQIGDRLDLVCPATSPSGPNSTPEYEYYKLYLVATREQADRCEVMGAPNLLLTCDKPNSDMRFTIKFQEYSPNLWGHEFKNLRDYYIIAEIFSLLSVYQSLSNAPSSFVETLITGR
ncbi:hypothetical protein DNTS_005753 [Danionella cerebrum]|uniref:Ephrin RBD domain-containing protein n=1 Tax=Danionella cerebrum TaxID=2873325 RepID=A0A553RBJ6_9TELE|nr:hypothetical protein DNTS_005753 [Danionella translucida]